MSRRQSEPIDDYAYAAAAAPGNQRKPLHFQSELSVQTSLQHLSIKERTLTSIYGAGTDIGNTQQSPRLSQIQPLGAVLRKRNALLNQKLTMLAKERIEHRHEFDSIVGRTSPLIKILYGEKPSQLAQQSDQASGAHLVTETTHSLEPMAKEAVGQPVIVDDYSAPASLRQRKTDIDVSRVTTLETRQPNLVRKRDSTPTQHTFQSMRQNATPLRGVKVAEPRNASVDRRFEVNRQEKFVTDKSRHQRTFATMLPKYMQQRFDVKLSEQGNVDDSGSVLANKAVRNATLEPFRTATQGIEQAVAQTGHRRADTRCKSLIEEGQNCPSHILAVSNVCCNGEIMIQDCNTFNPISTGITFKSDQKEEIRGERRFKSPYQQLLPILGAKGDVKTGKKTRVAAQNTSMQKRRTSQGGWSGPAEGETNQNGASELAVKQLIDCKGGGMTTCNQKKPPQFLSKDQQAQVSLSVLEAASHSCLPQANMSFNSQNEQPMSRVHQATQQKSSSLFLKSNECNTTTQVGSSGGVTSGYTPWSPSKTSKIPNSAIIAVSKAELIDQLSSVNSFMAGQRQRHQTQGFSQYINAMQQEASSYTETRQNSLHCPESGSSQVNGKQNPQRGGNKGRTTLRNGPNSGQATTVKTEWSNGKGTGILNTFEQSKPEVMKASRIREIAQGGELFQGKLQSQPSKHFSYANPAAGQKIIEHGGVVNQQNYKLPVGVKAQMVPFNGTADIVKRQGSNSNFQFSPFVIDTSQSPAWSGGKSSKKPLSEVRPHQKQQKPLFYDHQAKDQSLLQNRAHQATIDSTSKPKADQLSKHMQQQMGEYYAQSQFNLTAQKTFSKLKRVADLVEPSCLQGAESQIQVNGTATEISPRKSLDKQAAPQLTFPAFKGATPAAKDVKMVVGKAATYSCRKQPLSSTASKASTNLSPTNRLRHSQNKPVIQMQDIKLASDGHENPTQSNPDVETQTKIETDQEAKASKSKLIILQKKSSLDSIHKRNTFQSESSGDCSTKETNLKAAVANITSPKGGSVSPRGRLGSLQHATSESLLTSKGDQVTSAQPKTSRNEKQGKTNKTEQMMKSNQSEKPMETEKDSESEEQQIRGLDQSLENYNQQSTCSIQVSTQKPQKSNDGTIGKHRQSRGTLTKTGNRNKRKRKAAGSSIISSKPSLHSNANKVGVQAVPAVHDISTSKFVTDPRKLETYYLKKPEGQDSESTLPANLQILQEHKKSSNIFASRYHKRHSKRKESHSVAGHSSHLSSTKSQPKISIRNSKGSLRSSSAVRSSKPLKAVASSNCAVSAKDYKLTPDQAYHQPTSKKVKTQPTSILSRPRIITKEASATSVGSYLHQKEGESSDRTSQKLSKQQVKLPATTEAAKKLAQQEYLALKTPGVDNCGKDSKVSLNSSSQQPLTKASHVQRVRQMQNSQKLLTLEVKVREVTDFEQRNPSQSKEPQSASKVFDEKPKQLLPGSAAYSAISRCASSITSTLEQKQNQSNSLMSQAPTSSRHNIGVGHADKSGSIELKQISILQTFDHHKTGKRNDGNEDMQKHQEAVLKTKRVSQTVEKLTGQDSLVPRTGSGAPITNHYSTVASQEIPSFKQSSQYQDSGTAAGKTPRLVPSLACKPGSAARQQPLQQTNQRSFQADDDYVATPMNQPYTSCRAYVITDSHHNKVLQSKNQDEVREMASLTKIMTTIVVLELAVDLNLDLRNTYFRVSPKAASTIGTSAYLIDSQVLSIWDLLHGLMLPSGNDAAMVLAENFTELLHKKGHRQGNQQSSGAVGGSSSNGSQAIKCPSLGMSAFIKVMNKTARKIHMRNTNYANPHGLADKSNHSTARELAMLSNYGMKNELFRQIVNTKSFSSINFMPLRRTKKLPNSEFTDWSVYDERDIPFPHGGVEYVQYHQTWYNSNKLLDEPGFCGVKTGQTNTAGACLSVYYKNPFHGRNLVAIVLGSKSIEYRWKDTRRLTLWVDSMLVEEHQKKVGSPAKLSKSKPLAGFRT